MSNIRKRLRDWSRGYSDEDVASAREKLRAENWPESRIIEFTPGEYKALAVLREEREQAALDQAVAAVEPPTDWFNSAHAASQAVPARDPLEAMG